MANLTLNRKELERKIGKISKDVEEKISMFGTPVDRIDDKEVEIEVFPNRPDLLSMSGFTRAMQTYLKDAKPKQYSAKKPEKDYKVIIEKPVKKVRQFTVCAIVKNLKFDDEKIKEIIDIQEKLHITLGRKRKKLAIGVYPMEKISLPITYTAKKPEEIIFIPLEESKEMNARQILSKHPTGREYAALLEGNELFPVFIDGKNKVLSLPPIINSNETGKISEKTKEVFIECSGFNLSYLKKTLNIIVTALADMGGEIYSMEIEDKTEGKFTSPNLEAEKLAFKLEDINKTLGKTLQEKEVIKCLEKMGILVEKNKENYVALIPAYRTDILHWIDLVEEVAIAHGYENFKEEIPKISTIAEEDKKSIVRRKIAEILSGLNFLETSSYHLTTKHDIKMLYPEQKDFIEVEESKTEYSILRQDLLSNTLKILSENSDSSYPQNIFETGRTFLKNAKEETGIEEKEKLSIAMASETANFTEIKQVLDYLMRMLGKEYKIEEFEHLGLAPGRTGKIIVNNQSIGFIGEVHPRALKNLKIKMPVSALEIDLDFLY